MRILAPVTMSALAVVLLSSGMAHAADYAPRDGFYLNGGFVSSFQSDADSKISGTKSKIKYESGWGVTGAGGYGWSNGLRAELELAVKSSDVDRVSGVGEHAVTDGTFRNVSVMTNVLYDIATGTRFTPYVGAGIGASFMNADDIRTVNGYRLDDDRAAFAYQAIAGVAMALDQNWGLSADYRYFATTDTKFDTNVRTIEAETENASHNVMVKLSYKFGAPEAAPVPVYVAPQPVPHQDFGRPAIPDVGQSYLVFFDFDKSVLTPEAKNIIAAAAHDFKAGKFVRIVVTGHTDTMGTAKYNQKLSERRASAVKKEFVAMGVPSTEVMTSGAGKNALLVPTADGVREAQNRRAEIVMAK